MSTLKTTGITEAVTLKNLPTLRQAFVVASGLIIVGYVLEALVDPIFGWLPLVVAGGLLFSAVFGFCPMVYFLQLLPWNKKQSVEVRPRPGLNAQ